MDLLSILGALWRHKFAVLPVILLTLLGAFYVIKVKSPTYSSSANILLVNPPSAPTPAQVAVNPRLKKLNPNNPYANLGGLLMVADAVINVVTSPTSEQALVKAGTDPRYEVVVSSAVGLPPIIQVSGLGSTPQEAILSAKLVTKAAINDLYQMQKAQGVNPFYMIKSVELVPPSPATASVSSKLRTLIALLALSAILLFLIVSVMDVIERRRKEKSVGEGEYKNTAPRASRRGALYSEPPQSRRTIPWPTREAAPRVRSRAGRS